MNNETFENFKAPEIFNGTYTVKSPKGGHRTFRIKTQKEDAKFAPGERVIALLTGPDNTFDYRGFGFVKDSGSIAVWRSKRGQSGDPSEYEIYAVLVSSMIREGVDSRFVKIGYELLLERACLRCNKKLTTPESIERGIGPICAEKTALSVGG